MFTVSMGNRGIVRTCAITGRLTSLTSISIGRGAAVGARDRDFCSGQRDEHRTGSLNRRSAANGKRISAETIVAVDVVY